MAALFHTLFTSLLQYVFTQRQVVIYLNVVRAELKQCRMLLARAKSSVASEQLETCHLCIHVRAAAN